MLVLSLLCSIRLTAVNDREARLAREIAELERENESLRACSAAVPARSSS